MNFNLDFPLRKEFRELIEFFCKIVEGILRGMPKKNKNEDVILTEHGANLLVQSFFKQMLNFQKLDFYFKVNQRKGV